MLIHVQAGNLPDMVPLKTTTITVAN
uniref:Uncharacterized protein n=1 Tax=Arundo donax TaxID=35708 RepID=A0A0A9AN87_ARUDO